MAEKFQTKKSLGQHFLNSAAVPRWMCDAGEVRAGDTVLEIGPGTGALTRELLARGAAVIALETDRRAIAVLEQEFASEINASHLQLVHQDARRLSLAELGLTDHGFKVIANIPYYLTGHLFRVFLDSPIQPGLIIFLVQQEVAKRATARLDRGEKESLLSLSIQAFGKAAYVRTVGRGHFTPPPKVDSAILKIADLNRDHFAHFAPADLFAVLRLGFGSKRKQLTGNLAAAYPKARVQSALAAVGLRRDIRAEDVPFEKWLQLMAALRD